MSLPLSCPVCGFQGDTVSPSDSVVALRSLPRRYRALLARPDGDDDEKPDDIVRRPGPDGWTALDLLAHAAEAIGQAGPALRAVIVRQDPPDLPAPPDEQPPAGARDRRADDLLAALREGAEALATQAGRVAGKGWTRTGRRATGDVRAIDLLREAVHEGVHHLRDLERTLASVRGRPAEPVDDEDRA